MLHRDEGNPHHRSTTPNAPVGGRDPQVHEVAVRGRHAHTASNLNSLKIRDVVDADIVIVASKLFKSSVYLNNLEAISGAGELPAQDGRFFDAGDPNKGARAVMNRIKEGRKIDKSDIVPRWYLTSSGRVCKDEAARLFMQTKRFKGKSYRDIVDEKESKSNEAKKAKKTKESVPGAKEQQKIKTLQAGPSPKPMASVEVAMPVHQKRRASPASSVATVPPIFETEPDESDAHRTRRAVKRKAIFIDDDDEPENDTPEKDKVPAKKRPEKRSKTSDDDDYVGSPTEESDSEEDPEEDVEEESDFDSYQEDEEEPKKAEAAPKERAPAK